MAFGRLIPSACQARIRSERSSFLCKFDPKVQTNVWMFRCPSLFSYKEKMLYKQHIVYWWWMDGVRHDHLSWYTPQWGGFLPRFIYLFFICYSRRKHQLDRVLHLQNLRVGQCPPQGQQLYLWHRAGGIALRDKTQRVVAHSAPVMLQPSQQRGIILEEIKQTLWWFDICIHFGQRERVDGLDEETSVQSRTKQWRPPPETRRWG